MEVKFAVVSELEQVSFQLSVRENGHYLGDKQDEESIDIFGSSWGVVHFALVSVRITYTNRLYASSMCDYAGRTIGTHGPSTRR